jgi:hypothetical protein
MELPYLERRFLAQGAHKINLIRDVRHPLATGWSVTFDSEMTTLACTRQLLDSVIKKAATFPKLKSSRIRNPFIY